jgi:putative NADPH-quinone reductase
VYAHPSATEGHNAQVLQLVKAYLDGKGLEHKVIDLYRDGFDPTMPIAEWRDQHHVGPQAAGYQAAVKEAERLIFIYPVWWYTYPAVLKGFFDRVFTPGFAYNMRKVPGWMKLATSLFPWFISIRTLYPVYKSLLPVRQHLAGKKALMINTYGGDEAGFRLYGHTPQYAADRAVLEFCGVSPVLRTSWYDVRKDSCDMPPKVRAGIERMLGRLLS